MSLLSAQNASKSGSFGNSEIFILEFFDRLWEQYRQRVSYVRTYEELVKSHNATFFNDHIALRTIATQVNSSTYTLSIAVGD